MSDEKSTIYRVMHLTHSYLPHLRVWAYSFRRPVEIGEIYNPRVHFAPRETSAFLNKVMPCPYIQCTWDLGNETSIDEAFKVLIEGLSAETVPGFPVDLGRWEYFSGTARDHIKAVFVPKGSDIDLEFLGIHADIKPTKTKTSTERAATVMKRLNRLFAPVQFAVFGNVTETVGETDDIVLTIHAAEGQRFDIRILPATVYTDGMNLLSPRGWELLAGLKDPKTGDSCRITVGTPVGMAKGHAMVVDGLRYDAVLYGVKPELTTDQFYFGRLSELHVSDPSTDFQSLINFMITGNGLSFLGDMCVKFFRDQLAACQDSDKFKQMMRGVLHRNPGTGWLVARAVSMGLDACFPGLFRANVKMLMGPVERTRQGVVSMSGYATRRYIMPSPWIFDSVGNVDLTKDRLGGNCVFTSDVNPGPVVLYRQPNGNVDEHVVTRVVSTPYPNMGHGQIVYLASDLIPGALKAMGGGDFDDPVIVVYDESLVGHFTTLPAYPRVEPIEDTSRVVELGSRFVEGVIRGFDPNVWSVRHLMQQIEDLRSVTGIGVVVNAIMLDTLITIGKESMLKDLSDRMYQMGPEAEAAELERYEAAYKWLLERPDYVLRVIASDLESRIDNIKMQGGGGVVSDTEIINAMYESTQVFPDCWTRGGFQGKGRIPDRFRISDPLTAKTQLCQALGNVDELIQELDEAFNMIEWSLVRQLPSELLSRHHSDKELDEFVISMRQWWRTQWAEYRQGGGIVDAEVIREVYQLLESELETNINDSPFADRRQDIAVTLARRIYRGAQMNPHTNDAGELMHVSDGLLWTAPLGNAFLEALEAAGLTGIDERVTLNTGIRFAQGEEVMVTVNDGVVVDFEDGRLLGTVAKSVPSSFGVDLNGKKTVHKYHLRDGYITLRESHPSLKAEWNLA